MATRHLPPDRDPHLRQAFALPEADQIALLRSMSGEATVTASRGGATFQPVPVTVKPTPRGGLSMVPTPFPSSVILAETSQHLNIVIDYDGFRSRQAPRTPAPIADLEEAVRVAGPERGIVTLPYQPPKTWTIHTIRAVIGLMLEHLPKSPNDTGEVRAGVTKLTGGLGAFAVFVDPYAKCQYGGVIANRCFSAKVLLGDGVAVPTLREWWRVMGGSNFDSAWPLTSVDETLAKVPATAPPAAPTPQSQWTALDALRRNVDRLCRAEPSYITALGLVVDGLLDRLDDDD